MSAATAIVKRTLDLVPGSPARCLLDLSGRALDPVIREGTLLALHVTGFVLLLASRHLPLPEGWQPDRNEHREILDQLQDRARPVDGEPPPNILALVSWVLGAVLGSCPRPDRRVRPCRHGATCATGARACPGTSSWSRGLECRR